MAFTILHACGGNLGNVTSIMLKKNHFILLKSLHTKLVENGSADSEKSKL